MFFLRLVEHATKITITFDVEIIITINIRADGQKILRTKST